MELLIHYLVLATFWKLSSSLHCFVCAPEHNYEGIPTCDSFDSSASDRLQQQCEHSTMCFKRETSLDLGNGIPVVSVTRGCASQTMSGNQAKINGKWTPVDTIYDVYKIGCHEDPNVLDRPTKTINCYCEGDLCNNSYKSHISYSILFALPILYLVLAPQ